MTPTSANMPVTVSIPDPPTMVDNVYQPSPYQTAIAQPLGTAAPEAIGERRPSPYDNLLRGNVYQPSMSQPYVVSTPQPVMTQPYVVAAQEPLAAAYISEVQTMPAQPTYSASTTYAPAVTTTAYQNPQPTYQAAGNFAPVAGNYQLVPAPDIPPGNHPNDYGPSQWFEIIRPDNAPIRIGRVSSTCFCVGVRVPNRHIGYGERALIEARTMTKPPARTVTYGIFVNIAEPQTMVLDADVTVRR